jgi:hypothetical protein
MRTLLFIACTLTAFAQEVAQTPPASDQKPADQKPADQKPADQKPAETAASPVPSGEPWINGYIDLGYRWLIGPCGSTLTYKSIVDLNSGPKILGADFTLFDPKHRLFDRVRVHATTWGGGEPYETVHVDASKTKIYDFNADYRDFAYFNYLPSYADPLLARGIMLNEQAFETRTRVANISLDLWPTAWVTPYVEYSRDSISGQGTSVFVTDANQFPVPDTQSSFTNVYRGGLRFKFKRVHATVEEGATGYHSSQNLYWPGGSGGTNFGNILTPAFGQVIDLKNLMAAYGITGSSNFTRALFTANATSWLDVYGQFLYSEPSTSVNYNQFANGNFLLQSQLLFYSSQQFLLTSAAKLPHTTGNAGAEIRPYKHIRITESWLTDRMHNASSAESTNLLTATPSQQIAAQLAGSLVDNYNQNEVDIFWDATSKLLLRGGYRYVWGNATDLVLPPEGLAYHDSGTLHRNVGLGGFTYRPIQKLSFTGEAEAASSTGAYFRTSLYNYQRIRGQLRYRAIKSLSFALDAIVLDNSNPVPGVNYNYSSNQESASVFWSPRDGKYFDFQGSYTYSDIRSNIGYLVPQTLTPATSLYTENANIGTALFNIKLPHSGAFAPKLTAGGSFFISGGSRPTNYYQPLATLWVPFGKRVNWFAEWRYYGYGEAFYLYEGFRAQLMTTGLRISR